MANQNIKPHVFHEFYSNKGYSPNIITSSEQGKKIDKYIHRLPIHFNRAVYAAKDPFSPTEITEFKSEESALEWYKKNKFKEWGKSQALYDKISKKCKNYIKINASDIGKYKEYFHGMIKGIKFEFDIDISAKETAGCGWFTGDHYKSIRGATKEGDKESGSFTNPTSESLNFKILAGSIGDDRLYVDGADISPDGDAQPIKKDYIGRQVEAGGTVEFYALDTVGGQVGYDITVDWGPQNFDFEGSLNYKIDFDSTKIFEISDLQGRSNAITFEYNNYFNTGSKNDKKNKEELTINDKKVFKDNWKFDKNVFMQLFKQESFTKDTTYINDPIVLPLKTDNNIKALNYKIFIGNYTDKSSGKKDKDILSFQKTFDKTFSKFGESNLSFEVDDHTIIDDASIEIDFEISDILYIKDSKVYLCFIEFHIKLTDSIGVYYNRDGKDKTEIQQVFNVSSVLPVDYYITTNDSYRDPENLQKYKTSDCSEEQDIEFENKMLKLNFLDKNFDIEYYRTKKTSFEYKNSSCSELKDDPDCKDKINITKTYTINKDPKFTILTWKSNEFNAKLQFPQKAQ